MKANRIAGLIVLSAALLVASVSAAAEDCDVTLTLEPRGGRVDGAVLKRVKTWLEAHPVRVVSVEESRLKNGERRLCLAAPNGADIDLLFDDIWDQLPETVRIGTVRMVSRTGLSVKLVDGRRTWGRGYSRDRVPRDNGLPSRP
jgi:hypothetical protein